MKWFIDPSRYPTDHALLVSPPVIAGFAFALAAVALAYVVQHRAPEPRWAKQLERYAGFGPLALGVFVGVALMAAALEGLLFVPSLRVTADAVGAVLRLAEFAIGAALALGATTRPAAIGLALLGALPMVPFSLESILEQVHLLGAAICLFVVGRGPIAVDARTRPAATASSGLASSGASAIPSVSSRLSVSCPATSNSRLSGKCRKNVLFVTPARSAICATVVASYPCSVNRSTAARTILSRAPGSHRGMSPY